MVSTAEARVAAPDSPSMATFTMAILTMATFGNDHGHPCYGQARVAALDQAVETARQEETIRVSVVDEGRNTLHHAADILGMAAIRELAKA